MIVKPWPFGRPDALTYSADHFSRAAAWVCVLAVSKRQGVVGNPWRKDHVYAEDGTPLLWRWRWFRRDGFSCRG
mgnify:CR=1 FL=1